MNQDLRRSFAFAFISLMLAVSAGSRNIHAGRSPRVQNVESQTWVIPFSFVNRHIVVQAKINNSEPLLFLFDTGAKYGIVALSRARQLGLNLTGEINANGGGSGVLKGAYCKDCSLVLAGLENAPQTIHLALPLDDLEIRFGQRIDGIIGGEFIKNYVVEVDYDNQQLRLHNKSSFNYSGKGEVVPFRSSKGDHPLIQAEVNLPGTGPVTGTFVVDLGAGGGLSLYSRFVSKYHLPAPTQKTINVIGASGTGGAISGRLGRIASLKIGSFVLKDPVTLFSTDKQGTFATTEMQGNIGTEVFQRFKVFLDYDRHQIILEPGVTFNDPEGLPSSGLSVLAEGKDFKTFKVNEILPDSPGSEAGIEKGDVIVAIQGTEASKLTLPDIIKIFQRPVPANITIRRGDKTFKTVIKPRLLI